MGRGGGDAVNCPLLARPLVIGLSTCEQKITFDRKPPLALLDISTSLASLVLVISRKPRCCRLDIVILIEEAKTSFKEIKV